MDKQSRREALQAYKEKKTIAGVYAIRCAGSDQVWVAGARNVESQQTRFWFSLKNGGHINKAMQGAWTTHGADSFSFESLETIDYEALTPMGVADAVKARERHWLATLGALKAAG